MTQQIAVRDDVTPAQFDANIVAAQHKAKSLKAIVDSQGLSVRIGASEHLKVEAWLTIAAGYGYDTGDVADDRRGGSSLGAARIYL